MNKLIDEYLSISGQSEGLYKENYSRFISFAIPVETEKEVKDTIDAIKKKYHDARHWCFAYRLGVDGEPWRLNDDGEPSGTAGRPILGQIDSAGLSDVLVVVVRYFGGIKLGVPGLIAAYKAAAADAIANARKVKKCVMLKYKLHFSYSQMPQVMKTAKDMGLKYSSQNFGNDCTLDVKVRLSGEDAFKEAFKYCCIEKIS